MPGMRYPLIKPDLGKEELNEVREVLETGFIAQGPTTKEFEKRFAEFVGCRFAMATNSCTTALQLAVASLGIGPEDEVLVPSFTFPASGNVVARERAKPVLVDVDLETFCIQTHGLEEKITEKTKAVMPVHLFGHACDMDSVTRLAKERGLRVIEDAANALGTFYKGKHVGYHDVGCFSFHPRKILSTGEGGMLCTDDQELFELAASLKNHGSVPASVGLGRSAFQRFGFNYRLSDILAAVGLAQLRKLDARLVRRKQLAEKYISLLKEVEGVRPPIIKPYSNHSFQSFVCLLDEGIDRDAVIKKMADKGVQTQIGTYALHLEPAFASQKAVLPDSKAAFERSLTLPLYASMNDGDPAVVVDELKKVLRDLR